MAKNEFSLAFNDVLEDKQLSKEVIISAIESDGFCLSAGC